MDEFYWEDRPRYYAALQAVRREGEDMTSRLEYSAARLLVTLEQAWARVQKLRLSRGDGPAFGHNPLRPSRTLLDKKPRPDRE
ncbi:MAG TPA: hypothetical protein PLX89_10880 [Verrucomicrobiota bacterium]|nr:hypothetical protein [Verrucomicrobiales bacterium]HRI13501.1 hypothetical protein [Verrucomicrobiota bacterium]